MIPQGFRVTRLAAAVVTILSMAAPLAADIPGYTLKRRTDFSQEIHPRVVAAAPDGKVWFADERYTPHSVGFFTPADGKVTKFPIPCDGCDAGTKLAYVESITVGPDGNAWFVWTHVGSDGSPLNGGINSFVSKVTTAGVFTAYAIQTKDAFRRYIFGSISNSMIATGPDGNLWFTEKSANGGQPPKVGKITTAGAITEYTVPTNFASPAGITAGPDGNVWFAESERAKIARITPAGTITEFPLPSSVYPYDIVSAPDGKLWFTDRTGKIGRITTSGAVTMYDLDPKSGATQIAVGKDNNLYFTYTVTTDNAGNYEGRIGQVVLQNVPAGAAKIVTNIALPSLSFEALINKAIPFDLTATDGGLFATAGEPDASSGQAIDYMYELQDENAVPACTAPFSFDPEPGSLPAGNVGVYYPGVGKPALTIYIRGPYDPAKAQTFERFGALPTGINSGFRQDVTGAAYVIEGTPGEAGVFTFTLRARIQLMDGSRCALTGEYTIDIEPPPAPALDVLKTPSQTIARQGDRIRYFFGIDDADDDRQIRIVDPLPAGMEFHSSTWELGTSGPLGPACTAGPPVTCTVLVDRGLLAGVQIFVNLPRPAVELVNVGEVTATTALGGITTVNATAPEVVVIEGRTVDGLTAKEIQLIGGRP